MEKSDILFSVLVPVYNVEQYLDDCVESVLAQTYPHYELILVNDGSTDSSGEICDRYAARYDNIRVFHKENVGQLHTRKYALDHAKGDYCVFLDSDDYLDVQMLERMHDTIARTDCDCVIFGFKRVCDGKVISVTADKEDRVVTDKRELYRTCFLSSAYNSVCRKVVRTSLLQGIDYAAYYHIKHGEDLLQSLDILRQCRCVAFLKEALYNYRYNPASVTSVLEFKNFTVDNTVRETVLHFLQEEQIFTEKDFEEYRSYCIRLVAEKLCILARYDIDKTKKYALFDNIKASAYYTDFLQNGAYDRKRVGKYDGLYRLFVKGHYGLLITIVKWSARIKKLVKR